jgi:asparagine synthase (glutamine-hydrolysing)
VVDLHRYWEPSSHVRHKLTLHDAQEELDPLLSAAVQEQMLADVPVGLWISGGVDSSLILNYVAQHARSPLRTFSIRFPGEKHDESCYSRALAAHFGTRHEEYDVVPNSGLPDVIRSIVHFADEPNADAGAVPLWYLSAHTTQHCTVALSGEGADELFGGYHTFLADKLSSPFRLLPGVLLYLLALLFNEFPVSDEKIGMEYKIKRFLSGCLLPPGEAHFFWNGTFSEGEKRELCRFNDHPSLAELYRPLLEDAEPSGIKDFLKIDQTYYLADNILAKCDRMSMAHSVEVRPPFLDDRVVDFACALPPRLLGQNGRLKPLLKSLLASKLPSGLRRRGKEGLDIPIHCWLRGPLYELVADTLSSDRVERAGLLSADSVSSLLRSHLERKTNVGYHLWGLLILGLWIDHWQIDTSDAPVHAVSRAASIAG